MNVCGVLLLWRFSWLDVNQELVEIELKYQGLWQKGVAKCLKFLFWFFDQLVVI